MRSRRDAPTATTKATASKHAATVTAPSADMADVSMPHPGVWLVTCCAHGYIGAAIHMARDRADELADQHNRTHHLEGERTP